MLKGMLTAILLSFLLTLTPISNAQDIEPPPWPPEDTSTVFPAGIEVVDMTLMSGQQSSASGGITISVEESVVMGENGRQYRFPRDVSNFEFANPYVNNIIDGKLFIVLGYSGDRGITYYYMLDLNTGEFSPLSQLPETLNTNCGPVPFEQAHPDNWVLINGSGGQEHMCNITTGLRTSALPDGYYDWFAVGTLEESETLVLRAFAVDADEFVATLFAFNPQTYVITQIGVFAYPLVEAYRQVREEISVIINATQFVYNIEVNNSGSNQRNTYFVDLSMPSITQTPINGAYYENPPRLETFTQIQNEQDGFPICERVTYDLLSDSTTTYRLNSLCFWEFGRRTGNIYYRVLKEDEPGIVDVISLNSATGDYTVLYTGEVENIAWVSEDERYIALILDSDGHINTTPGRTSRVYGSDPQLTVIDLNDGRILHQIPARSGGIDDSWRPRVIGLENDWLAFQGQTQSELINLLDDSSEVRTVHGYLSRALEGDWHFLYPPESERDNEFGSFNHLSLYNFVTQEELPLVTIMEYGYWLDGSFSYVGDGIFEIGIGYGFDFPTDVPHPTLDYMLYHVRVPEMVGE